MSYKSYTTIALTQEDIAALLLVAQADKELYKKLAPLEEMCSEDSTRFLIEAVRPSFMTSQERLNDLEELIKEIKENNMPPSKYRKEHQLAIGRAVSIARTLFWKEQP